MPRQDPKYHLAFRSALSLRIKAERERQTLTRPALAEISGVHENTIREIELMRSAGSAVVLYKISEALDVSADYLMGRTDIIDVAR